MMLMPYQLYIEMDTIDIMFSNTHACILWLCIFMYIYGSVHVGHRNLIEFSPKNVINTLHDVGFADADCEQLALQLDLSEQMRNIR